MGTRFILLTLAIGIAAINTGNNLLYLILAMLLSFIIFSGILSEYNLRNLTVFRTVSPHPFAGKRVPLYFQPKNKRTRLPCFSCTIQESPQPGIETDPVYIYHLGPGQRSSLESGILFKNRGRYRLSSIKIETGFPFGFFQKSLFRFQSQELVVFPRLLPLPQDLVPGLDDSEESYETYEPGHGSSIRNLRDYTPSDDARAIHWKASARQGKLMLKEFEDEEGSQMALYLVNASIGPTLDEGSEALERAISLTASLADHWIKQGHSVRLETLSGKIPMDRGIPHLVQMLKHLALLEPMDARSGMSPQSLGSQPKIASFLILPQFDASLPFDHSQFSRVLSASDPKLRTAWGVSEEATRT